MNELIKITPNEQGSLVVSSLDYATGLEIQHKNLLETIRTHQEAIESNFGRVAFETEPLATGGGKQNKLVAYLTEDQALFVGTLSRNSKRVVEFKATLVKSFADARRRIEPPAPVISTTEQVLLQLVSQSNQILASQSEMLLSLRADVDSIMQTGHKLPPKPPRRSLPGKQLGLPGMPPGRSSGSMRQTIHSRILDYCQFHQTTTQEVYSYLYKRLFEVYGVNAHRLMRTSGESVIDSIERYGHLDKVYSLIMAELAYNEE
ncbi:Rha family transcriptional regulator [Spirosoma spitsbergense]|uniref:Rha family transcriptional regulator n=1 Tax=Spirosoma spitsbergense TaxID=431554 RepID=UPI00036BB93D|nr:Rha family transcriptional regulator [Spirosoma spitsbergense]